MSGQAKFWGAGVERQRAKRAVRDHLGLMPLQHGTVEIDGKSIAHKSIHAIRAMAGMVHEDRMIYGVSNPQPIEENLISRPLCHRALQQARGHEL